MKTRGKLIVLSAVLGVTSASLAMTLQAPVGDPEVVELLSGISYSPNKNSIDLVMGAAAIEDLIAIAEDSSAGSDPGVRIRAWRALGEYPLSPDANLASDALRAGVTEFASATTGTDLLLLRACMLSLAQLDGDNSVADLVPRLSHTSRDIRASAAQALGITGSSAAYQPLLDRALVEQEAQVKLAIADALFELDQANASN